jgi:hypothetical protein
VKCALLGWMAFKDASAQIAGADPAAAQTTAHTQTGAQR